MVLRRTSTLSARVQLPSRSMSFLSLDMLRMMLLTLEVLTSSQIDMTSSPVLSHSYLDSMLTTDSCNIVVDSTVKSSSLTIPR